jgi:hypothetical protein
MKCLTNDEALEISKDVVKAALDKIPRDTNQCCARSVILTVAAALVAAVIKDSGDMLHTMRTFVHLLNEEATAPTHGGAPEEPLPTSKAN